MPPALPSGCCCMRPEPESVWWLANWCAIPLQTVAMLAIGLLLAGGHLQRESRPLWWLVLGFTGLSVVACFVWNLSYSDPHGLQFTFGDGLYLLDYLLLTAGLAQRYPCCGRRAVKARFWLDALTISVALLVVYSQFLTSEGIGVRLGLGTAVWLRRDAQRHDGDVRDGADPAGRSRGPADDDAADCRGAGRGLRRVRLGCRAAQRSHLRGSLLRLWRCGVLPAHHDGGLCRALSPPRYGVIEPSMQESANGFLPALLVLLAVAVLAGASSTAKPAPHGPGSFWCS